MRSTTAVDLGVIGIDLTHESAPNVTLLLNLRRLLEKHNLTCPGKSEDAKASMRAKVEHCFDIVNCLFKHGKTRYRGLANNNAQLFTLFGFANLVLARRFWERRTSKLRPEFESRPQVPPEASDSRHQSTGFDRKLRRRKLSQRYG